jgi:protein arginine kinase
VSEIDVCVASVARFSRCVKGIEFPRTGVGAVDAAKSSLGPALAAAGLIDVSLTSRDEAGRLVYFEKGMASAQFCLEGAGALYVDPDGSRYATVGDVEHARLHAKTAGLDVDMALDAAMALEEAVGAAADFCVSKRFGYVCSDIASLGTGLRVECFLHLPALEEAGLLEKAFKAVMAEGLEAGGRFGAGSGSSASIYSVWNPLAIGESEEGIAKRVGTSAQALVELERCTRDELMRINGDLLADRALRAYGLARHCVLLPEHEAIEALASIRLGICLGFLSGMGLAEVDAAMTGARNAHVRQRLSERSANADPKNIEKARARFVREAMQALKPA